MKKSDNFADKHRSRQYATTIDREIPTGRLHRRQATHPNRKRYSARKHPEFTTSQHIPTLCVGQMVRPHRSKTYARLHRDHQLRRRLYLLSTA